MSIESMTQEMPGSESGVRRRNTVLAALEILRGLDPGITVNNMVVFLYIAENEGLNVSELAAICGLHKPTASRSARALASRSDRGALPPYLGLIRLCNDGPAINSRTLRLTAAGRALCARLEDQIAGAVPILVGDKAARSTPTVAAPCTSH